MNKCIKLQFDIWKKKQLSFATLNAKNGYFAHYSRGCLHFLFHFFCLGPIKTWKGPLFTFFMKIWPKNIMPRRTQNLLFDLFWARNFGWAWLDRRYRRLKRALKNVPDTTHPILLALFQLSKLNVENIASITIQIVSFCNSKKWCNS